MPSFRFALKPTGNNTAQIRAVLEDAGNEIYRNTGYTIPANKVNGQYKHWNKKDRRVRQLDNDAEINTLLSDWQNKWDNYVRDCKHYKRPVSIQAFRDSLEGTGTAPIVVSDDPGIPGTLSELAKEYVRYIQKTHKARTIMQYENCQRDIELYESKYGKVALSAVNTDFYRKFGLFMVEEHNNFNNTINRKISRITTLMNYAAAPTRRYVTTIDYKEKYKFKPSKAARFPLQPKEVEAIKKLKLDNPRDQVYLDAFRFACETTLRFSDVLQLLPVHKIERVIKGQTIHVLDLTQIKTTHGNILALSDYALQIWQQYAKDPKKKVFQISYSQTANDKLKDIFEKAELNRKCEIVRTQGNKVFRTIEPLHNVISFHMSRNTAITFQLSELSPATVMQNAGIKKLETVLRYYRDDEEKRMLDTLAVQNRPAKKKKDSPVKGHP